MEVVLALIVAPGKAADFVVLESRVALHCADGDGQKLCGLLIGRRQVPPGVRLSIQRSTLLELDIRGQENEP